MLFGGNRTGFSSKLQETVWAYGRAVVPFDVSTAEITDKEMLAGLRQVYDFNAGVFSALFEKPEKYIVKQDYDDPGTRAISILRFLCEFAKLDAVRLEGDEWVIKPSDLKPAQLSKITEQLKKLDLLAPMGLSCEKKDGDIRITNTQYPMFVRYYVMLVDAAVKRKAYIWHNIVFCDFRILNKRLGLKFDDTIRSFTENNKAFALELHDFLLSKGCKPSYTIRGTLYEYNKYDMTNICGMVHERCRNHGDLKDMSITLNPTAKLGRHEKNELYENMVNEIEKLPNRDEMLSYMSKYRKRCAGEQCVGRVAEFCFCLDLKIAVNAENSDFSTNHDMKMIKLFLDLRIKAIDNLKQSVRWNM